ncbi:MAG: efflux RND transporter permease subunit, partial [Gemmatimonadota bacterium]
TAALALGAAAFLSIPVELLPDVRFPRLTIQATWPGATPEAVEALVTTRLEAAAQQVTGAREVSSASTEGRADVTVEFARDAAMDFAALELGERLGALQDVWPPGVVPRVEPYVPREFSAQDVPFLEYALYGTFTTEGLREFAERQLRPELLGVDGVTAVRIYGGEPREIRVELDPRAMEALGLSARQVLDAVLALDVVRPAGTLVRGTSELVTTVAARMESPGDLAQAVVVPDTAGSGRIVRLGDVARILDTRAEPWEYHRINGRPAITLSIVRGLGTNALRVADRVKANLDGLRRALPAGLDVVLRRDESAEIRRQLTDLRLRAGASAIVVFLVLLVFLGSFRSSAIVFSTIAFSTLLAVNLLYVAGLSLNLLTLAGLAMAFGLIVDNAIVVLENVYRRWRAGEPAQTAAEQGAREVALPIVASTLTTVIVFVPFLYLQGELRLYYLPFAYAVGLALLASLAVAFTFVPAAAARMLAA